MSDASLANRRARHHRADSNQEAPDQKVTKSQTADFAEDFLYAGLSALLLLVANFFASYWLLSIVAFAPFLYRVTRVHPGRSFRLGLMLGLAFFGVNFANNLIILQFSAIGQVLIGGLAFGVFGWVTGTVQRRLGFSPIITALLWVALELALIGLGFQHYILLDVSSAPQPYFGGIAALFGTVMISFAIVFLNSLFLVAIEEAITLCKSSAEAADQCDSFGFDTSHYHIYSQKFHLIPENRGPPTG